MSEALVSPQITSSKDVYDIFHPILADLKHEEVWVLFLNRANKVVKNIQISKGGMTATVVDIRLIMKEGIQTLASAMVLCHNHPSGNTHPSDDDDQITKRLKDAGYAARKLAEERFSRDKLAKELEQVLFSSLQEGTAGATY